MEFRSFYGYMVKLLIGMTMRVFRKVFGQVRLKHDDLFIILGEGENIINSRCLMYLSENTQELPNIQTVTSSLFLRDSNWIDTRIRCLRFD
ncbi:hypothetical protein NPIL_447661 [Nephila pilipes]|uniref:Uncharacterized protein n=1 Tax=Nephila pilipes TaxID=299642 RepID=A0A8X6TDJ4_NEPPI|nr:hypothetical protein NPIL_447661 [Nephila pilipes]